MSEYLKRLRKYDYNIDKFENEAYLQNPLMKFRLRKIKKKRKFELLKRKGEIEKAKLLREPLVRDAINEDVTSRNVADEAYIDEICKFAESAPIPKMLSKIEQKILHFAPKTLRTKYPQIVNAYMADVQAEYEKTMKSFSVRRLIRHKTDDIYQIKSFSFKRPGKTANYKVFLLRRRKLKDSLFIPYPFIRFIIHQSKMEFPSVLNDFQNYRQQKTDGGKQVWLSLAEFESMVEKDLQTNSIFLKEEWYPKIVKVLQKYYKKKKIVSTDQWPRILNCAKGLIKRQITELKVKTFQHIFKVLDNRTKMPCIKFQAIFTGDNTIELHPSFENLSAAFRKIFEQIALIGQKFPALEPQIDRNRFFVQEQQQQLNIEISRSFMHEIFVKLEESLKSAYAPILAYVDEFRNKFCDLYGQGTKNDLLDFLKETRSFEEYLEKIDFYRNYQNDLQKMVYNEYFDFSVINQTKATAGLKIIAKDCIADITSYIVTKHKRDCGDICNWFESVKKRAFEAPKTTESLLANGEFMLEVKNKELGEIQDRIQYNLKISGILIELTEITDEHRQLQVSIVQWLQNMQVIFEQNSVQFEIYKNQFEEHLGNVTKKFVEDIDSFVPKLAIIDDMYETEKLGNYYATLKIYIDQLECFEDYANWIAKEEKLFKLPVSHYPILDEIKNYLIPFANLVKLCMEWLRNYYVWMDGPFEYLDAEHIEHLVKSYQSEFEKTQKYYRNKIKQDMMGNPVLKFRGQTEDPDPEKHPVPLRLCERMIDWIKEFDVGVYIVKIMCNPALHDRHWIEMSEIAGFNLTPNAGTTLRKITKLGINDKLPSFEIISTGANKELQLRTDLVDMTKKWESIQYPTTTYKDTNIQILSNLDDIQVLLEDHLIKTLTMRGSAFVKPCETEVRSWYDKLLRINNVFDEWTKVQIRWLYYIPIFATEHIVQQIPREGDFFEEINKTYKKYISMIIYDPIVLKTATMTGLLEDLIKSNELLDKVEVGVNAYLERTRLYFPRFYFLSNLEILQMLSETKNPLLVQPFLCKCYDGIHKLEFDDEYQICAMISSHLEKVTLVKKINIAEAKGRVEEWLRSVEVEMKMAIGNEIMRAYSDFLTTDWIDWIMNWPQMVILCIVQIFWVSDIHSCLIKQNRELLQNIIETLKANISELTLMVRYTDITHSVQIALRSLCIILINARDVSQVLLDNESLSTSEFHWIAQLKYYWKDERVVMQMIDTTMAFGYEYLGNYDRLVITPLTERCYRTIVAAFHHHIFGALEGTTGAGKLETVKDLTKALAIQCRVFNCSAELDYKLLGNFFKGVISCGAWLCFDDFNRIKLDVLSVIAEQMRWLSTIISSKTEQCSFLGTQLYVDPSCYLCILNNSEFGARFKLPDNLKVLFRTVAMMVPDFKMIAETLLCSYGFTNGKSLAIKLVTLYECCSQQLSDSDHYDFGLRNIRAVLSHCENYNESRDEYIQLYESILKTNLPKLLTEDLPIFMGILTDLFPNVEQNLRVIKEQLPYKVFCEVCQKNNLQPTKLLFTKLLQTYEIMNTCHSFVVVGKSFSCKTILLKVLTKILSVKNDSVQFDLEFVTPKSVTIRQLFGEFNPTTQAWADGIIPSVFRKFIDSSSERKWLIFDGPIDCEWIESMHTVLDDNRKLCLASGEIIQLCSGMSILFETEDLTQASPATVSRLGIIYMDPSQLEWETVAKSWIEKCNPKWMKECRQLILDIFEWILPPLLVFLKRHCVQMLGSMEINLVTTTFDIFEMIMNDAVDTNADDYQKFLVSWIQAATVYSIVWGIGGLLDKISRDEFDRFHRKLWNCSDENPLPVSLKNRLDISLPSDGNLADYVYLFKQKGVWKLWADLVRRQDPEDTVLGTHVSTVDTGRYSHLLEMHIKHNRKILLVGPNGTGKSTLIQHMLSSKLSQIDYLPVFISFNIGTNANDAQDHLISKLIKLKRFIYGPPKGKQCIAFIDDLNLPTRERYGALTSVELLRHYFNYEFMYDLKTNTKIYLENFSVVCACGAPAGGGSWNNLSTRFLRHFSCFSINEFTEETLFRIFSNVLMTGLKKLGHASDVINHVNQMISATLRTFNAIILRLKPTPTKSFYRFNIRDIARICNGCALLRKESVDNKKIFAKIWFHESMREFHDRLIDSDERVWLFDKLCDQIRDTFKDSVEQILETQVSDNSSSVVTIEDANRILFGSYANADPQTDFPNRRYEEITNFEKLTTIARKSLSEYNAVKTPKINIVLFTHALEHLNRICRIISIPVGGNGLIIGMGDSGRKSLTKLAAFICKQSFFQTKVVKDYGVTVWKEDIKSVLKSAGGLGKQTVFLLSENEIREDSFLTDIDHLLSSADIPNLWPIDEKQELVEMVRLSAQGGNRNIDISPLEVFSYFVNRCRQNLHIILCFSPIGSSLRNRLRLYPSLLNCCTIDWFDMWPDEALEMVAKKYTSNMDISDKLKETVISTCIYFHTSVKEKDETYFLESGNRNYTTSASYLELVYTFCKLYNSKRVEIIKAKSRYVSGLETLQRAAEAVENMQVELSELQPRLLAMAENSQLMTLEIEQKTLEASVATEQVKRDELIANDQAAAAESMEDECSKDLAQAVPVLEDALQALNTLKPSDITLVKSMKNPPSAIKLVMAAVCVMKGVPPDRINDAASGKKIIDYWGPSKRILGDMAFLQSLKDYDKDDINPDIIKKIRKDFIPHKEFQPHVVAKASSAAEGLCKWVKAIENFESVNTVVRPKKMKLLKAKGLLKETRKFLAEKRALAAELEAKVIGLYEELEKANEEKLRTEREVELCERKLKRAEALISGLESEKRRWTEDAARLQNLYDHLIGDILISCGMIAYLGPFTKSIRDICLANWHEHCLRLKIPCSNSFNLIRILGSETDIRSWNIDGLSTDRFSIENVIMMYNSCRPCLFVDPQRQANKWIRSVESVNRLHIVKFSQFDYFDTLKKCIQFGHPILIEDIHEKLEIVLEPILRYNVFFDDEELGTLNLNEDEATAVTVSENFRLYLTCNLQYPHFLPDVSNKVNIINFFMDQPGLEEKLLNVVVAKERPDLREERDKLLVEKVKDKELLNKYENDILIAIAECEGDILENESAIKKLDDSKQFCAEIFAKQKIYAETEKEIDNFRDNYESVARHAAIIYSCLIELLNVNTMYQFSLDWFINLYIFSIENANRSKDITRRINFLISTVTKMFYNSVCRSIFEKDKFLFSWILTTKILLAEKRITVEQLRFFVSSKTQNESNAKWKRPHNSDWISESLWIDLLRLSNLSNFEYLIESIATNLADWESFSKLQSDENLFAKLPSSWKCNLSNFEKLILIKIIHSETVITPIREFISMEMGSNFVNPPHFDIGQSFEQSNILTPLIFLLSPGVDPIETLLLFARRLGMIESFQMVSLGQDQEISAEKFVKEAQAQGSWICLQNCHLSTFWLFTLETICSTMNIYNTTSSFRLWMTTENTTKFPLNLLQSGIKMTFENPKGLQSNLLRTYSTKPVCDASFYNGCPGMDRPFARLLYSLAFFHAIVQERKHFNSIGWNNAYDFGKTDFEVSIYQIQSFLSQYEKIPYAALNYLIGECNYSGQVTDQWDFRLVQILLSEYMNEEIVTNLSHRFANDDLFILPRRTEHREIVKYIEECIPNEPNCDVYGLHSNYDIAKNVKLSKNLLNTLSSIMKLSAPSAYNIKMGDTLLNFITSAREKMPKMLDISFYERKYSFNTANNPFNLFLVHEAKSFNRLLNEMKITFAMLEQAIEGSVWLTSEIEEICTTVLNNKVPVHWQSISYLNTKPIGSYIRDFYERFQWIYDCLENGIPLDVWLSGFFHPHKYFICSKQEFARKYQIAFESITFTTYVCNNHKESNCTQEGVIVNGLYLEGAHWNPIESCIEEQLRKTKLEVLPVIHMIPKFQDNASQKSHSCYKCPLYMTMKRSGTLNTVAISNNFIISVMLPTKLEPEHWIKRGTAIFCQTNE